MNIKEYIESGKAVLGIEFGSTRIKAVLIGPDNAPIASGNHDWENRYENGIWTYTLDDIETGLQDCYASMAADVKANYGAEITKLGAIGISAMMHGYMVFDKDGQLLTPFRTWRNTITEYESNALTMLFNYNIPQRWSIAHLYHAILKNEAHVPNIDYMTTLAGYIHRRLTGKRVLGVGEASGMFPIDINTHDYDNTMVENFNGLIASRELPWKLLDILPTVLCAGDDAGTLTAEGASFLDPSGKLEPGCPLCPPEGDAGTGMVATNTVTKRTGNVSAGTSVFAMIVLEKELSKAHQEIDLVTTPAGDLVAMVHANNCTSDINAWAGVFKGFAKAIGAEISTGKLFDTLFAAALDGDPDCGKLLSFCYFSGEPVTGFSEGRPLFIRTPESNFTFANFMRTHLYSALGVLKVGLDILFNEEKITVDKILGHGGFFKAKDAGQSVLAAAMNADITVTETAGEGGAWGIALLASYLISKSEGETLSDFLNAKVFNSCEEYTMAPDPDDVKGFNEFIERYKSCYPVEQAAIENI